MRILNSTPKKIGAAVAALLMAFYLYDHVPWTQDQRDLRRIVPVLMEADLSVGALPENAVENPELVLTAEKAAQRSAALRSIWSPIVVDRQISDYEGGIQLGLKNGVALYHDVKVIIHNFGAVKVRNNSAHVEFQGEESFNTWNHGWISAHGVENFSVDLTRGGPSGWQLVKVTSTGGNYG